jgi:hypothetical protein
MGYKTNGNCQSVLDKALFGYTVNDSIVREEIGSIHVTRRKKLYDTVIPTAIEYFYKTTLLETK